MQDNQGESGERLDRITELAKTMARATIDAGEYSAAELEHEVDVRTGQFFACARRIVRLEGEVETLRERGEEPTFMERRLTSRGLVLAAVAFFALGGTTLGVVNYFDGRETEADVTAHVGSVAEGINTRIAQVEASLDLDGDGVVDLSEPVACRQTSAVETSSVSAAGCTPREAFHSGCPATGASMGKDGKSAIYVGCPGAPEKKVKVTFTQQGGQTEFKNFEFISQNSNT